MIKIIFLIKIFSYIPSHRNNRAAELRRKSTTPGGGKSRSGSINSIAPATGSSGGAARRGAAEKESLRRSCQVVVVQCSKVERTNDNGWLCQLIKGCDPKLVETILNEVIPRGSTGVSWADVAGQDKAKVTATQY